MEITVLTNELLSMKNEELNNLIQYLMHKGKLNVVDIINDYTATLQDRIEQKDAIIKEADNCIFNSMFYDHLGKTDSANVILDKVRWRYKYADTNKEELCKMFNYDPDKDK